MVRPVPCAFVVCLVAVPLAAQGWLDAPRWYPFAASNDFHQLADLDGDGDDDVLWLGTLGGGKAVQAWLNDGRGELVAGPVLALPAVPGALQALDVQGLRRLGDVTGDGVPDLLMLETGPFAGTPDVAVHAWAGVGDGSFVPLGDIPLVDDLQGVALGQTDGDPALEVALLEEVGSSESVRWWDWNGAAFTASAEGFIFGGIASPQGGRMVALDLDGDGDDDLVFGQTGGKNLRVLDTVAGAPVVGQLLTVGDAGTGVVSPYLCDLPGGGPVDLLVVDTAIGSSSALGFTPVAVVGGLLVAGVRQDLTAAGPVYAGGFEPVDWDGDGDVDLACFAWQDWDSTVEARLALFEQQAPSTWSPEPVALVDLRYPGQQLPVGVSDMDGDGHPDFVGPQAVAFGNGRFESAVPELSSFYTAPAARLLADREGDGDLDLYEDFGGLRTNGADGIFSSSPFPLLPAPPAGASRGPATAIADLTGDGRPDFLMPISVLSPPPFPFPVFSHMRLYADSPFGFSDAGEASTESIAPLYGKLCAAADLDLDGDRDLLDPGPGELLLRLNDGAGHFPASLTLLRLAHEVSQVADLDGDGDADLLATDDDAVLLDRQLAPLVFDPVVLHAPDFGPHPGSLTLLDADGDGDLDVAGGSRWLDEGFVLAGDGSGGFTLAAELSTNLFTGAQEFTPMAFAASDVDGDGLTDLLVGADNVASGPIDKVALFRGLGGLAFEPVRWYAGAPLPLAGDLDGDGDADLAGSTVVRSRQFDGPQDGVIRQYGAGWPATSGVAPLFGASGPLRPGSTGAALHVRQGVGGAPALLLFSFGEAALPGLPFAASTLYVQPPFSTLFLVLGGAPGVPAAGALDLPLTPVLADVAGLTLYHQLAVFGGPGKGKTTSNGLQLTYGE